MIYHHLAAHELLNITNNRQNFRTCYYVKKWNSSQYVKYITSIYRISQSYGNYTNTSSSAVVLFLHEGICIVKQGLIINLCFEVQQRWAGP
jgi:hypothetical protein